MGVQADEIRIIEVTANKSTTLDAIMLIGINYP
jgi:hypothetical protein